VPCRVSKVRRRKVRNDRERICCELFFLTNGYAASLEDRASLFISVLPYAGEQKAKAKARDTEMCGDSVGWCMRFLQLTRKAVDGVA
jgi:hypothetical protein